MSDLSALKRLCAYYLRHHVNGFDRDGLEEEFIDTAANLIQDRMPTADIEKIRPFMISGNVNEWIPLGQAIDEALNPVQREAFVTVATSTVFLGNTIPAHDETFDLAESIGTQLDAFREYVASVRDAQQADAAVTELLTALLNASR